MVATEAKKFSNIAADTAAFSLKGGLYQIGAVATWGGGSLVLKQLQADGTTYLSVSSSITANGGWTGYLAPGTYKFVIATATAVYCFVASVPIE